MSIWDEIKETLFKFSETAINKTETVTLMAKHRINIKNKESEIDKVLIEIGKYTVSRIEENEKIEDNIIGSKIEKLNRIKIELEELKKQLDDARAKFKAGKKSDPENEDCKEEAQKE